MSIEPECRSVDGLSSDAVAAADALGREREDIEEDRRRRRELDDAGLGGGA